ncbi:class I SAM-dependent methyltransferase [Pseudonocardia lacus]|uniref:class I SAM-dependent methyltransferase n=1 Tax=Pseudonocardia lacus TaxID=2835865 RepID=UPI001BDCA97C|nr:methyltransferase domain-containing protein [Pseudonocardia lacus]
MEPPPPTDPRLDLVAGTIELCAGSIGFVRPRDATALLYEDEVDQAYPPYWAELWPSGVALAHAVSARARPGAAVLELGCGLGLPAIAAALGGARVLATDRSPDALTFTAVNAEHNGVAVQTAVCSWEEPDELLHRGPWDLVLAADVLYGQRNVDTLLALLPRLVARDGEAWIADPRRPLAGEFLRAARERWASVETAPGREADVDIHRLSRPLWW